MSEVNDQRETRIRKLSEWRNEFGDAYPSRFDRTGANSEIIEKYKSLEAGEELRDEVQQAAGRIMAYRKSGKLAFVDIYDRTGKIQILAAYDRVGEENFKKLDYLDIGDFIGVKGNPIRTRRGEMSLAASDITLLSKSLRPLPEKWHGLRDTETRYRRRYLDMIMNSEVRVLLRKKSDFVKAVRRFMEKNDFTEIDTPTLELLPGGADAKPFITHHHALDLELYLRISLELPLKRLIVGGFEKVYEMGMVWRNEGMSAEHLQEFMLMEFYWAYVDYEQLMDFVENMYVELISAVFGTLKIEFQDHVIDFTPPWPKIKYRELILEKTGIDLDEYPDADALAAELPNFGIQPDERLGRGRLIDQLYKKQVRPHLIQPLFLIDHPLDLSPLAKKIPSKPDYVQRFQVLFAGSEVGNGFSELNDPLDQADRFKLQAELREKGDEEAQMFDRDFVEALEFGMPPTGGFGVGIDRFFYILSNASSIREIVTFPLMKPEA